MNPATLSPSKTALRDAAVAMIGSHLKVLRDGDRDDLIHHILDHREAIVSACGALATWTPPHSSGRIPKDTYMVRDEVTVQNLDWSSSACNPMEPAVFDQLWSDALQTLAAKDRLYESNRCVGADPTYALPVKTIGSSPLTMLFADNMFREVPDNISHSRFADQPFVILVLPHDDVMTEKYAGVLRDANGQTVPRLVAMDFERRLGIIYGSRYCGCVKKLIFTAMNYLLPEQGILPLHSSANEAVDGSTAVFLGLSGTGKTTISTDAQRSLIADDEVGWSNDGIANFENGCYAKLINLDPEKEPGIVRAVFTKRSFQDHGCIVENAMVYPNGRFDLDDDRIAENSRASYPLEFLENTKMSAIGTHPNTIIFLTADAYGVLPPIAKLNKAQAMLWFLMAYTSKLAGTEVGVTEPQATFSRFFGEPFMPRHPNDYARLLGAKLDKHGSQVYLVNTGWTGGPYGVGQRMDINDTRAMVNAALDGSLDAVEYQMDNRFHVAVPTSCPGVEAKILQPRQTWADPVAYDAQADKLAAKFAEHFAKQYGDKGLPEEVVAACPGK